ncbi:MazG nucleotide pyrophosphohydrolase domain-containing protein [Chondrinema litorale]|uniref:MazG nucleotide pyrophosphohydrolase domain-containing protein n=1 Tax=Chondrinema litorale TaxID=2994555 RepID=UPI0025433E40|nr:MazG nucleotide pyrophosphohydrolase domain-containing protein [Chondrinema litorale]UZR94575.1 RS21-C6 protein [Chondrinema litorale]
MPQLPEKPELKDFQDYIKQLCIEKGWNKNNHLEIFLLFMEEVGELAKAMRNAEKLYQEEGKAAGFELEEEFADVFNYLLDLANHFNIDLEEAFRKKNEINKNRKWTN